MGGRQCLLPIYCVLGGGIPQIYRELWIGNDAQTGHMHNTSVRFTNVTL